MDQAQPSGAGDGGCRGVSGIFNPDNGWEVVLVAFLAVCGVASAVLPVWLKLSKIDGQVSNSHDENLRDEITRGFKEVRADMKEMRADIGGLREELRTERIERIEGDRRRDAA